jgi:hypothetical protein
METDKTPEETPDIEHDWWLIAKMVGLVVVGIWLVVGWMLPTGFLGNPKDAAALGDGFGMVNALFSGLAFAGLLVTLWMQRTELRLQRTELQLQRAELVESREVMREQTEQLAQQREQFERQVAVAKEANNIADVKLDLSVATTLVDLARLKLELDDFSSRKRDDRSNEHAHSIEVANDHLSLSEEIVRDLASRMRKTQAEYSSS